MNGLFRFATLLFGQPEWAGDAILQAARQCGGHLEQFRREKHSLAFLVRTLREVRAKDLHRAEIADEPAPDAALGMAFSQLAEPDRSALALLYADLFPFAEMASLLNLSVDELAEALGRARRSLAAKWQPADAPVQS